MHMGKWGGCAGIEGGNEAVEKEISIVSCELPYVCWYFIPAFKSDSA